MGDYYRGDYYRGDPGLFSFLGKALGGVAKFALGAVKSAVGLPPGGGLPALQVPQILPPRQTGLLNLGGGPQTGLINIQRPAPPVFDGGTGMALTGVPGMGLACTTIHGKRAHLNKSTYITRGGGTSRWPQTIQVHPRGTECVGPRRMNVGNARALRRALRRVSGFAKLVKRSRRAVARAASAVGVHRGGKKGRAPASVRVIKG